MKDKFYFCLMLIMFIICMSVNIHEAEERKKLENKIALITARVQDAEKDSRIARQDTDFVLKLISDKLGGKE